MANSGVKPTRKKARAASAKRLTRKPASANRAKALDGKTPKRRGRQVIRQLQIVSALTQSKTGLSAQDLHELIGRNCGLRTVFRDLDQLQAAGFALNSEDGRWRLEPGARVHAPIDADELLAVMLAERVLVAGGAPEVASPLATLRSKLLAAVTSETRAYCTELSDSHWATSSSPNVDELSERPVRIVREAIAKEQRLALAYCAPNKAASTRTVDPYALWLGNGRPYLIAFCHAAQAMRTFALVRIREIEILDDSFDRNPNFRVEEFTQRGVGVHHGDVLDVVLHFAPDVAHLAHERKLHATQQVEAHTDGSTTVTIRAAGLPEIAAWVASFGGKVRVEEPTELKNAVIELFRAGLKAYGDGQ